MQLINTTTTSFQGYKHHYPFFTPECGLEVVEGKFITPLYRHMININFPSMILFGVPIRICPFIMFDGQVDAHSHSYSLCFLLLAAIFSDPHILCYLYKARYYVKYLEGKIHLPSKAQMLTETNEDFARRKERGLPMSRIHEMDSEQWGYNETLANEANFTNLIKPFTRKIYEAVGLRRKAHPQVYRKDEVILLDDNEKFELVEAI
jgi:hypothetical protein